MREWTWGGMVFLGIGLLLLMVGLLRGEGVLVLEKGINICLECMGLG
ncbi:MAG: thioredoxin [Firmicutes bacterium]|nr:thioredoxin [Bacillota bacterium]